MKEFEIPSVVTCIGFQCFCKCKQLNQITLPSSLRSLEERGCFWSCPLRKIAFSEGGVFHVYEDSVWYFLSDAYREGQLDITNIKEFVCWNVSGAAWIQIPQDMKNKICFKNKDIVLSRKDVGEIFFREGHESDCFFDPEDYWRKAGGVGPDSDFERFVTKKVQKRVSDIERFDIPLGITIIGEDCFASCDNLKSITKDDG